MSARRRDCAICALPRGGQAQVYRAYQDTRSFEDAAKCATSLGAIATGPEARSHFQYHRVEQPPPQGHLSRTRASERAHALPTRSRDVLLLASRVRALSATQIAELLYWDGTEKQMTSARNACYRDLRRLALDELLYRHYPAPPPSARGASRSYAEQLSLYFLGRDGVPYVEEREGEALARRDWVTTSEHLSELVVSQEQEAAEAVCSLARQAKVLSAEGQTLSVEGAPALHVAFSPLSWQAQRAALRFHDPRQGKPETLLASSFPSLALSAPESAFSVLVPFFFEHDSGSRPLDALCEHLLLYLHLSRTGALAEHYPQLPREYAPPVVIVCRDMGRVLALQEEAHRRFPSTERLPVMVACDEATCSRHGLAGQCWLSLWDRSLQARRHRLVEVLLRSCRPLVGKLGASDVLVKRPTAGEARSV
jgi:hypothetical protein